ncbi:TIR domain-containing protein [Williamsoniiplasma luminosum]|uniref:TIR domain-containing protein n=1 Tax=Williamsoniiplasma luminosum TaxID=214888 RepID=UPI0018E27FA1|nr:TIR domain-containing protein [Williamsoniiplasma luminosum]
MKKKVESIGWITQMNVGSISLKITTIKGAIFNVFKTGKVQSQGKTNDEDSNNFEEIINSMDLSNAIENSKKNKIYVVHGHDVNSKNELKVILMEWGLETIVSQDKPPNGKTIIEGVLDDIEGAHYGIVLLTPDDVGYASTNGINPIPKPRARQNVILEMGMIISRLGRNNVTILKKSEIEQPSDTDGLIYIAYDNSIKNSGAFEKLRQNIKSAGITIKD